MYEAFVIVVVLLSGPGDEVVRYKTDLMYDYEDECLRDVPLFRDELRKAVQRSHPTLKIAYVTCEPFTY